MHELAADESKSSAPDNARPRGTPGRLNDEVLALPDCGGGTSSHGARQSRWSDDLDRSGHLFADSESDRDG